MLPNQYLGRNVTPKKKKSSDLANFLPKNREYAIKIFSILTFVENFVPKIGWFEDISMLNNCRGKLNLDLGPPPVFTLP